MRKFYKIPIVTLTILFALVFFSNSPEALAATSPGLGTAGSFGILSSTFTNSNTSPQTIINGDVCFTTGPVTPPLSITGATATPCPPATGIDQGSALADLNGQACLSLGVGAVTLDSAVVGANPPGTFPPGCYMSGGAMNITATTTVTLNGSGTYIFKSGGALNTGANSNVVLSGGACASDVFWAPVGAVTVGANAALSPTPTFVGNILSAPGITLGHFANLTGRALAFGGTVTTDANTITVPTCVSLAGLHVVKVVVNNSGSTGTTSDFTLHVRDAGVDVAGSPAPGAGVPGTLYALPAGTYTVSEDADVTYTQSFSGDCDSSGNVTLLAGDDKTCTITNTHIPPLAASINVVKIVVNDNGGTNTVADFPLFVNATLVTSGVTNVFPAGAYAVTETSNVNYTTTFSGDCDSGGLLSLIPGDIKVCVVTNDDIVPPIIPPPVPPVQGQGGSRSVVPPLIDVVKVPSPLSLPNGPGPVTYTYTLRNIGTVPVSDVSMVGDTCSPITLLSGDTDADGRLDVNEIWIYSCSMILSATHTNIVTATGQANSISAVDVASATVVVGIPGFPDTGVVVPPLIHLVKVPNVFLLPFGGGAVTYTYTVTNPGTEPLSDVSVTDDKCTGLPSRVVGHPGDLNGNNLLESNEAWSFVCQTNLAQTTTNTGTAEGSANGMIARDLAIATVAVSIPGLPNTGFPPREPNTVLLAGILGLVSVSLVIISRLLQKAQGGR